MYGDHGPLVVVADRKTGLVGTSCGLQGAGGGLGGGLGGSGGACITRPYLVVSQDCTSVSSVSDSTRFHTMSSATPNADHSWSTYTFPAEGGTHA